MEILIIIKNFIKQSFDTKSKFLFFIGIPVITFVAIFNIFGSASTNYKVSVAIADNANNSISKVITDNLVKSDVYKISYIEESNIEIEVTKFDTILIIPQGYNGKDKLNLRVIKNPLLIKGLESQINRIMNDYNNNNTQLIIKSRTVESIGDTKYLSDRALGFLLVFMFGQALSVTTLIIRNRENKTYYRLKTTPLKMSSYLVGNLIAAFSIVMLQVIIGLLVIYNFFSFSIGPVIILLSVYALVVVSIGLLITSLTSSRDMAGNTGTLLLTPTAMLGGCFWSVDLMPEFMQKISLFTPQYWTMNGLIKVTTGESDISENILILFAFSLLTGLFAIYNFRNSKV